jgi:hypothetical protein
MLGSFHNRTDPPSKLVEGEHRLFQMVRSMLIGIGVVAAFGSLLTFILPEPPISRWVSTAAAVGCLLSAIVAYALMHRGSIGLAVTVVASAILFGAAASISLTGVSHSTGVLALALPIILAGMLSSRRSLWLLVTLTCLLIALIAFLERFFPSLLLLTPNQQISATTSAVAMILTALMIGLLLDRIGLTIARTLSDLRAANRQLRIELRRRTSAEISLNDRETHLRVIAEHTHDLIATLH